MAQRKLQILMSSVITLGFGPGARPRHASQRQRSAGRGIERYTIQRPKRVSTSGRSSLARATLARKVLPISGGSIRQRLSQSPVAGRFVLTQHILLGEVFQMDGAHCCKHEIFDHELATDEKNVHQWMLILANDVRVFLHDKEPSPIGIEGDRPDIGVVVEPLVLENPFFICLNRPRFSHLTFDRK